MDNENRSIIIPPLRFPGFEGEWGERKLGDSFTERIEKNHAELPLLSLGEDGLVLQSDTARKDNSNKDKSKYLRVACGDIAYNTMRMWQGRCVYASIEGIVSPAYTVCKPKDGIDSLFHYYLFKTHKMIQIFHQNSQGLVSDTLNLKFEAFSNIKYYLPQTPLEQKKIASFLSETESFISIQEKQLEVIKDQKRGLMQRLFPQAGCTAPSLRFPGFTGKWEDLRLGDIMDTLPNSTLSRADLNDKYGKVLYVHYGDILTRFGDLLDVNKGTLPFITDDLMAKKACRSSLQNGDIIMADTAEDDAVGKCVEIQGINECPVVAGLHTIPLRPKESFSEGYLGYYFNSSSYRKGLYSLMQGVKVTSLSRSAVIGTRIQFPTSLAEQQRIAECLSAIDEVIDSIISRIKVMESLKKGLMQHLFL